MNRPASASTADLGTAGVGPADLGPASARWPQRRDMAGAFRRAARHSKRIRRLRILVPGSFVALALGWVLMSWLNPMRMLDNLPNASVSKLVVSGSKVMMEAPRLAGFTRDSRSYEMTAKGAAQDLLRPEVVELDQVIAKVEMQDRSLVTLTADEGLYESKADRLTLRKRVVVVSSGGLEGHLSEAVVDIRKGEVVSEKPVTINMLNGNLVANRLDMAEGGQVIRFGGGVSLNMNSDSPIFSAQPVEEPAAARGQLQ